ncbi:unnamed protein product, partial [Meganyctiphanes norvegica]
MISQNHLLKCMPRECQFEGVAGLCSNSDIPYWFNEGKQCCKDDCECWVPQECMPRECQFDGVAGLCSNSDIPDRFNVGKQCCKDDCECWVPQTVCDPACVHGDCTDPNNCTCKEGWTGAICDTRYPINNHSCSYTTFM